MPGPTPPAATASRTRLAPPIQWFTDRVAALARSRAAIVASGEAPVLVVYGPAGVGKSALVNQLSRDLEQDFPDGRCHFDLVDEGCWRDGGVSWPTVADRLLRWLGREPADYPDYFARAAAVRQELSARRALLILDSVVFEPPDGGETAAGQPLAGLLPTSGPSATILITREPLERTRWLDGRATRTVGLEPLRQSDRVQVVQRMFAYSRRTVEPAIAVRWARDCGDRLDLLVRTASDAIRAQDRPVEEDDGPDLFTTLVAHPGPWFSHDLVLAMSTAAQFDYLVRSGSVEALGDGRHRLPGLSVEDRLDLLRENGFPDPTRLLVSQLRWYLRCAAEADRRILGDRLRVPGTELAKPDVVPFGEFGALDWLLAEQPNLEAFVRVGAQLGQDAMVCELAEALWPLYQKQSAQDGWITTYRVAIACAARLGDIPVEIRMRCLLSRGLGEFGWHESARAELDTAERLISRATVPPRLVGSHAEFRARQFHTERRYEEAVVAYRAAFDVFATHGLVRGQALTLRGEARALLRLHRYEEALVAARHAVTCADSVPDPGLSARALLTVAEIALAAGDTGAAARDAALADDRLRGAGRWEYVADSAELLARIAAVLDDAAAQRRHLVDAIEARRRAGNSLTGALEDRLRQLDSGR